jgi:hypothetical protein
VIVHLAAPCRCVPVNSNVSLQRDGMSFRPIHAFLALYALLAAWLVISGVISLFTQHCTFWVGSKVFSWSGRKGQLGGVLTSVVGLLLLYLAYVQFKALVAEPGF